MWRVNVKKKKCKISSSKTGELKIKAQNLLVLLDANNSHSIILFNYATTCKIKKKKASLDNLKVVLKD